MIFLPVCPSLQIVDLPVAEFEGIRSESSYPWSATYCDIDHEVIQEGECQIGEPD
jgi:hypothetical protein